MIVVMLKLNSRVSGAHGKGTIVAYNQSQPNQYLQEKFDEAVKIAATAGMIHALAGSFYSGDRYPYVVQFDNGYKDVYAEAELTQIEG